MVNQQFVKSPRQQLSIINLIIQILLFIIKSLENFNNQSQYNQFQQNDYNDNDDISITISNDQEYIDEIKKEFKINEDEYYNNQKWYDEWKDQEFQQYIDYMKEKGWITIYEFLQNKNKTEDEINKIYLVKFNDLEKSRYNFKSIYNRSCYNCNSTGNHICCTKCYQIIDYCKCEFICGASYPSPFENNKFIKCHKIFNNLKDISHECKGLTYNSEKTKKFEII